MVLHLSRTPSGDISLSPSPIITPRGQTSFVGAVDGGGINSLDLGSARVGLIGKPTGDVEWMLVDDEGKEVIITSPV